MNDSFSAILAHPLVSIVVGAAVTWFAAWYYYKQAADELRKEAAVLRQATSVIAYLLEHPDAHTEVQRDAAGNVIGVIVSAEGHAAAQASVAGVAGDAATRS
jgi:hypothetical protein